MDVVRLKAELFSLFRPDVVGQSCTTLVQSNVALKHHASTE